MKLEFRPLTADEIECRVNVVNESGCSLLLYKDARCDMNILDEAVGALNWQRSHSRDNANCTVSIWDNDKGQWISKEDTGTESFTEKEKGLASDSFKRACFNWGIGRELYTAPSIWVNTKNVNLKKQTGRDGKERYTTYDKFSVDSITVENGRITSLVIKNNKTGNIVYPSVQSGDPQKEDSGDNKNKPSREELVKQFRSELDRTGMPLNYFLSLGNVSDIEDMTDDQIQRSLIGLRKKPDKRKQKRDEGE